MKYVIGNTDNYLESENNNYNLGNITSTPAYVDNSVNYANNEGYNNNESHIDKLEMSYAKFNNMPIACWYCKYIKIVCK